MSTVVSITDHVEAMKLRQRYRMAAPSIFRPLVEQERRRAVTPEPVEEDPPPSVWDGFTIRLGHPGVEAIERELRWVRSARVESGGFLWGFRRANHAGADVCFVSEPAAYSLHRRDGVALGKPARLASCLERATRSSVRPGFGACRLTAPSTARRKASPRATHDGSDGFPERVRGSLQARTNLG